MVAVLAVVVAVGLALTACSGSSDAPAQTTTEVTTTTGAVTSTSESSSVKPEASVGDGALEGAVRDYTEAFLGGDSEAAYALLTERCHGETASAEFKAIVDQAHAQYGDVTITTYSESVNGNTATVTYELTDPYLNQTNERWVLEDGVWHNDEC